MIKALHIGDLHLGGAYPEKAEESIRFLIEQMDDEGSPAFNPDIIFCTGDTTEKPLHVHSADLVPLLKLVTAVEGRGIPIIFLQGTPSHEAYGFLQNLEWAMPHIQTYDKPTVECGLLDDWAVERSAKQIGIATLPALNKPMLYQWAKELGIPATEPDEIIRAILLSFAEKWKEFKGPKVLLGHWTVNGCQTASGQTLYGSDMSIGLDDIALAGADITLLGHIHKSQTWVTPTLVAYCGSAYACNWGELDKKSFNVIEFSDEPGLIPCLRTVAYPHRPMVKIDVEFTGKQVDGEWEHIIDADNWPLDDRDIEIKICYSVPKEIAAQVDDMWVRVHFKQLGIELAAVERTIRSGDRQRIADIGSKETTRDQYLAVCNAKGEEPRAGALTKCDEIDDKAVAL